MSTIPGSPPGTTFRSIPQVTMPPPLPPTVLVPPLTTDVAAQIAVNVPALPVQQAPPPPLPTLSPALLAAQPWTLASALVVLTAQLVLTATLAEWLRPPYLAPLLTPGIVLPLTKPAIPTAPLSVLAGPGNASAFVTWTAPASAGSEPITCYTVTAAPGGATETVGSSVLGVLISGLTNGTSYTFTVYATNAVGNSPAATTNAILPEPLVNYAQIVVNPTNTQIRNDVTPDGGTTPITVTDTFTADGLTFLWTLSHVPDTSTGPMTLSVGGQNITVGTGSGSGYELFTLATDTIALMATTAGVPASGTAISVTYVAQIPVLVRIQNEPSIAAAALLPNWGRFSIQPIQASGLTLAGAVATAETQLTLYGTAITKTSISVDENDATTLIDAGQQIQVMSNRLGQLITGVVSEVTWSGSENATTAKKTIVVES